MKTGGGCGGHERKGAAAAQKVNICTAFCPVLTIDVNISLAYNLCDPKRKKIRRTSGNLPTPLPAFQPRLVLVPNHNRVVRSDALGSDTVTNMHTAACQERPIISEAAPPLLLEGWSLMEMYRYSVVLVSAALLTFEGWEPRLFCSIHSLLNSMPFNDEEKSDPSKISVLRRN
jgi:hypothetical protein